MRTFEPDVTQATPARQTGSHPDLLGPGAFVPVVGPSGSGKDTLIRHAQEWFAGSEDIVFPRRLVTREVDIDSEKHESIDEAEYDRIIAAGDYALTWRAHGLGYIVPTSVNDAIARGAVVVANISRTAVVDVLRKYDRVTVVALTVPRQILAERLHDRGRETPEEIAKRLDRADYTLPPAPRMVMIDNVGSTTASAAKLIDVIERMRLERATADS